MSILSNEIERFIKELIEGDQNVELQRNELAQHFGCTPSQINYVLATRFTLDNGYVVETKRGSGGYIRIIRLDKSHDEYLYELVTNRIGNRLSFKEASKIILALNENGAITAREAGLMLSAVEDIQLPSESLRDSIRAGTLKAMLVWLMKEEG